MVKLTRYIHTEDARAQAEFYVQSLGGEIQSVMTFGQGAPDMKKEFHDKVMHLSLVAAGNNLFMSDSFVPVTEGRNISLSLEFATEAETRQAFDNLGREGKVHHPFGAAAVGRLLRRSERQIRRHMDDLETNVKRGGPDSL